MLLMRNPKIWFLEIKNLFSMVPVGLETSCAGKRTRWNSTRIIRMMRTLLTRQPFRSMSAGMARKLSQIVWVERFRLKPSANLPGIRQVRKPEQARSFVEGTLRWTISVAVVLQEHIAHPGWPTCWSDSVWLSTRIWNGNDMNNLNTWQWRN